MILFPLVLAAANLPVQADVVPPAAVVPAASLPADLDPEQPSAEWLSKMVRPCVRSATRATC